MNAADNFRIVNGRESRALDGGMHRFGVFTGRCGPIVLMYHSVEMGGGTPDCQWSVSFPPK